MKKSLLLSAFLLLCGFINLSAQVTTNLVFFIQDPEPFSVVLNGVLQNQKPQTNVKVTDLINPYYKVKLIFSNKSITRNTPCPLPLTRDTMALVDANL